MGLLIEIQASPTPFTPENFYAMAPASERAGRGRVALLVLDSPRRLHPVQDFARRTLSLCITSFRPHKKMLMVSWRASLSGFRGVGWDRRQRATPGFGIRAEDQRPRADLSSNQASGGNLIVDLAAADPVFDGELVNRIRIPIRSAALIL
jgi:hypothetical protein